jgi:hypothetical protein
VTVEQLATVARQEVKRDWGYRFAFWRSERVMPGHVQAVTLQAIHWFRTQPKNWPALSREATKSHLTNYLHDQDFGFIPPWLLAIIIKVVVSLIIDAWFSGEIK